MSPEEAVARLNAVLAHAWMIRTFLKHADEVQENEGMLDVPRTLYDSIRAVEPAFQRGDLGNFLRRLKGKLPKLRRVAEPGARAAALDGWRARAVMLGREVEVREAGQPPFRGHAEALADDGALLVRTAYGQQRILAGEVSLVV